MSVKVIKAALRGSGLTQRGGFIKADEFAVWPSKKSGQTWGLCGNYRDGVWRVSRCDVETGEAFANFFDPLDTRPTYVIAAALRGY